MQLILALAKESFSKMDSPRFIHLQQLNRGSPLGSYPGDERPIQTKMIVPYIATRIVQLDELIGNRVVGAQIWSFEVIASAACVTKVGGFVRASVLLCANMLHVKGKIAARVFRQ